MVTNPHKEDIPDNNAAVWNQNIDPEFGGQMRSIKESGLTYQANGNVDLPDVYESGLIDYVRELTITNATNANPIVVTTATNHHLTNGDTVVISGVVGNTAANGTWVIKNKAAATFELTGGVGDGAYTSGGAVNTDITQWDLVYIDKEDGDISVVENFYDGTEAERIFNDLVTSPVNVPQCIKIFNSQAQVGLGNDSPLSPSNVPVVVWRQQKTKSFFNDLATETAGVKYDNAICYNAGGLTGGIVAGLTFNAGTAGFPATTYYSCGVSLVYDGLQESPMVKTTGSTTVDAASVSILLTAYNVDNDWAGWDKRITGVKIYWAESSDSDARNLGLHRLIKTISINNLNWADSGNNKTQTFAYAPLTVQIEGGATYEEETGISETIRLSYVSYGMNAVGGGYHWMAKATVPVTTKTGVFEAIDWGRYIFRSQKFRPNMVDWSKNFVILPETPTDMCFHNNYLYAFSENVVYKINPETLIIEDDYFGAGVSARGGCVSTEYGMFFCNKNGAYQLTNNEVIEISDPIKEATQTYGSPNCWANSSTGFATLSFAAGTTMGRIVVRYLATKKCVLFIGSVSQVCNAFAYYLPTKQWYNWYFTSDSVDNNSGIVAGKDGELYISGSTDLVKIAGHASTYATASKFVSKEFDLGEPSQDKALNKIVWDTTVGTGTTSVAYSASDGSNPIGGTSATSGNYINTYRKTIQVYVTLTTNANMDSLDIIMRKKLGKR